MRSLGASWTMAKGPSVSTLTRSNPSPTSCAHPATRTSLLSRLPPEGRLAADQPRGRFTLRRTASLLLVPGPPRRSRPRPRGSSSRRGTVLRISGGLGPPVQRSVIADYEWQSPFPRARRPPGHPRATRTTGADPAPPQGRAPAPGRGPDPEVDAENGAKAHPDEGTPRR
jgi:hypothetical protein